MKKIILKYSLTTNTNYKNFSKGNNTFSTQTILMDSNSNSFKKYNKPNNKSNKKKKIIKNSPFNPNK